MLQIYKILMKNYELIFFYYSNDCSVEHGYLNG